MTDRMMDACIVGEAQFLSVKTFPSPLNRQLTSLIQTVRLILQLIRASVL